MHVLLLPWRYRLDLHRATMRMVAGDQEKIRSWEWKREREQGGRGQLGGAKSQIEHDWARCEGDEAHQKRELGQRQAGHTRLEAAARAISFCLARLTASNHAEAG